MATTSNNSKSSKSTTPAATSQPVVTQAVFDVIATGKRNKGENTEIDFVATAHDVLTGEGIFNEARAKATLYGADALETVKVNKDGKTVATITVDEEGKYQITFSDSKIAAFAVDPSGDKVGKYDEKGTERRWRRDSTRALKSALAKVSNFKGGSRGGGGINKKELTPEQKAMAEKWEEYKAQAAALREKMIEEGVIKVRKPSKKASADNATVEEPPAAPKTVSANPVPKKPTPASSAPAEKAPAKPAEKPASDKPASAPAGKPASYQGKPIVKKGNYADKKGK